MTDPNPQNGFPLELPAGDFAAYIFDCDGTLADTMPTHYKAWQTALGEEAQKFPEAMFYELGGTPTARIVEILNERHGLSLPVDETVARKEAVFLALSPQIAAIEPVVKLARLFHGVKPLAVASGGHRRIVMNTLRALGIADLFQAVVTSEDYQRGKPSPDPFLEAALRLDVSPEECLVFEDTATGIAAATAAGMKSVLVPPLTRKFETRNSKFETKPKKV
ncbi:MAG TPA: HAD family phosphatase [Chthoniobacteraceae bacterium]|nr:HAD family phosphatase [Chthoniobacteraceae bacterium]